MQEKNNKKTRYETGLSKKVVGYLFKLPAVSHEGLSVFA